jgi:hypothetical protein
LNLSLTRRRFVGYFSEGIAAIAQMVFFDFSNRYAILNAKKYPLTEIHEIVLREAFRPLLEQVWR